MFHFQLIKFGMEGNFDYNQVVYRNDLANDDLITATIDEKIASILSPEQIAELKKWQ